MLCSWKKNYNETIKFVRNAGYYALRNLRRLSLLSQLAIISGIAFLFILTLLHFLKPGFDPSWRMISEYELGNYGYLMSFAFFCWGAGFLSLTLSLWKNLESAGGRIAKWWLVIISIALFGAGVFITNPITGPIRTTANVLHAICGTIMVFTFPIASIIAGRCLAKKQEFKSFNAQLVFLTILVWVGLFSFITALIIYSPEERINNKTALTGWANRFMAITYTVWLITLARIAMKTFKQTGNRPGETER